MSTIPKGSTVLITGVNGFIASHVADEFLAAGYDVRGTARSMAKADWLYERFDKTYGKGKFECVEVADMVHEGAFDEAVKGVSGICHLASVLSFSSNPDEVIPPTVKGTLNILTSASKEPSVKSVVYTSSSTAALLPQPNKEIKVTKDTWDDAAVEAAYQPNPDAFTVYGASKTEAERAVWKAFKETKPPFQVATVLPNANFGTILQPGGENSSSTGSWVVKLWNGDASILDFPPQWFVDVRDTAKLHVAALIDPSANGQRIFAFAEPYSWNKLLAILRKQNPDRQFLEDKEGEGEDLCQIPNEDAEALLQKHYGHGWTPLEESLRANTATLKA
ncbi:hypothetical protein LTR36_004664 [Oleoguttula mirabilis]|uniref:NAD-dependent epimerase/dehydratase domain-containing protein n=1 Tax=Oleoguttula mirabilis TaxID=1507867 RepID=A0AAV9JHA7_9PEZI|nr:hypothetical protein LTR36_004664 [Oleoguttula mirabilis]